MKKLIIILTAVFTLLPFSATDTYALENYHKDSPVNTGLSIINDDYGFFDDDMLAGLTMLVQDTAEELDMNIYIFVAGSSHRMSDKETEIFSDDRYDEIFGEDTDGVFYFMDFTGKKPAYDYISTSGKAVLMYEENIQSIHNACQSILPPSSVSDYSQYKDDIANAISQFLTQLDYYYNENPSGYYADTSSGKYFYYKDNELIISKSPPFQKRLGVLVYAVPAGFIIALIFYFSTKSKYKFKVSANPRTYVENESINFTHRSDNFIGTHTTKTKIERNHSSGGGHSHGGGHGGGGSHR